MSEKINGITAMERKNHSVRTGQALIHLLFIFLCALIVFPVILTIIVSFSSEKSVMQYGYSFFPKEWSLDAYKYVFKDNSIFRAYGVTIFVTGLGTFLSVFICSMCGFAMSNPQVKYRNVVAMFLYIPTIVGAGLIPWYYTVKEVLHMSNTIWVLIFPSLVSTYNIFLIRNYYKGIPDSFSEAAQLEGAGAFTIFLKVLFPLALPITATVTLFVALGYWNNWFNAAWFIDFNHSDLYPLQYYLFRSWTRLTAESGEGQLVPTETGYLATMFVTMGPILLVYPFVQKYFMKGLTVGGVKG